MIAHHPLRFLKPFSFRRLFLAFFSVVFTFLVVFQAALALFFFCPTPATFP